MVTRGAERPAQSPEAALRSFIGRLDPGTRKLVRALRAALRKRFPAAHELAYDYSSQVVIAYGPTERGIDAIVSIAGRADGVRLYFNRGPRIPDPKGLLLGSGRATRYLPVESAGRLTEPDVEALIRAAVALSGTRMSDRGKGRLSVRGAAAKRKATREHDPR